MKKKTKIDGVEVEVSDGNKDTDDITMLDGELAEDADRDFVNKCIKVLEKRGYIVINPYDLTGSGC